MVAVAGDRTAATDLVAVRSASSPRDDSGVTALADHAAVAEVRSVATDGHVEVVGCSALSGVETDAV